MGSNKSKKAIIVTGAAGFIGFHLSKRLLDLGYCVFGFDNLNAYYDPELKKSRLSILCQCTNFFFTKGDLADKKTVECLFQKSRASIVVNLAAQAGVRYSIDNPQAYIDSNVIGFFNVLEACRHYPVQHLIFASSSSVYGNQKKVPFSVSDNVDKPISLYAATKKTDELMAFTYSHLFHIPTTGLRFFTVYGPFGRPDMAYFSFTNAIKNNKTIEIFNNGEMLRDFTYIDDIIDGIVKILDFPPKTDSEGDCYKIYNIGNNKPEKITHFIEVLENLLHKKAVKIYLPMQAGDVYQTYADISDFEKEFGFKPHTSIDVGLAKFVEWYDEYYKH